MPLDTKIKKVMVIGSGPIVIGQAAEFDYAGAQACRVLKDAGVNVVLVNSNPATIMTDKALADEIYLEPLTEETVKRIILKEKPDSLLAALGGQTGLTVAMQLDSNMLKMRVWERGNGETSACGTGACAAVAAAVKSGKCRAGEDITVKVKGGDLTVNYTEERIILTGNAVLVYNGVTEY